MMKSTVAAIVAGALLGSQAIAAAPQPVGTALSRSADAAVKATPRAGKKNKGEQGVGGFGVVPILAGLAALIALIVVVSSDSTPASR